MDERQARALDTWLGGLPPDTLERYFLLLDELCRGLDVSRHEQFGFLRLRAEFETSGEIFGCSLEELRDRLAERLPEAARRPGARPRPRSKSSASTFTPKVTRTSADTRPILFRPRSE